MPNEVELSARVSRPRRRALAGMALCLLGFAACSGSTTATPTVSVAASTSASPTPTATPTPTPEPTPTPTPTHENGPIVKGACIDFPGLVTKPINEMWPVECTSTEARYRVVGIATNRFGCPSTAELGVSIGGNFGVVYCLSEQLTGVEALSVSETVKAGDCLHVVGDLFIDSMEKVKCTARNADYRVIKVATIGSTCKAPADAEITITGFTAAKVLCLKTLKH